MKSFKSCLKGILGMMKPLRFKLLVNIFIGLVRIAASLAFVWISRTLVDIVTGVNDAPLSPHIWMMAGIMLLQMVSGLAASYWGNLIVVKTTNSLTYSIFGHVLNSRWNGKEEYHSGDITNRLESDIATIVDLICTRIPEVIITICQLIAASTYLLSMAPKLLWLLLILMVVAVFGSKMFFKTLRKLTTSIRKAESAVQQQMQENLQNRVLVLTLIGTGRVLEKLGLIQRDIEGLTIKRLNYSSIARGFMSFGFMAGYAATFFWGIFGIRNGSVTFGMMTAFLSLAGQVQRPIADLSRHIPAFIHALTSEERLMDLLELPLIGRDEGEVAADNAVPVIFDNVTFGYPGQDTRIFENFSYVFEAGTLTAIMGPTGAGKSTLIRLAMGLLSPESGSVKVYSKGSYMYVPQGNTLMSGTVRENLLLANPDATEDEMKEALRTAVAGFVLELPDGLDTRCGEVGTGLSEGQAQRIAIARALLHSGGILVLDEATSALDPATEETLLGRLMDKYHGRKTILFISHREKVCGYADRELTL